ncbi:tetratricopeptide repeat protein [Stenotrophomonas sp. HITSZ_GD]|uniref:tetratricopeptide repeat protein n=1 Tax=Stenotrophomonas sp. HITSZ_GD TaxID=3037248 RepID=UPI00240E39BF|nr:tetratricopeptide repeat protein [Stenotrophomonas sp. HITSZ_GD]MDG2523948.1 tetratricopeptide repeat protein [Stenotrophomonas sp. HITSZ_GD]
MAFGLAVCMVYGSVWAQAVPKPKEFYFDEDRSTTRHMVVVPGEGDAAVDKLAALVQRDPRAVDARVQLGTLALEGGRRELGDQLYKAALAAVPTSSQQYRQATWNYGWALLRAGDPEQALHQWITLSGGRPATPNWLPPTLALTLWKLDRKDEAVAWFAAAVRTWPDKWGDAGNFATLLPDWRDDERAALAAVLAAWQANPPAWP